MRLVQHLEANDDYDDRFLLYEYFDMLNVDEALFRRFVEEYVRPEARPDVTGVGAIVADLNRFFDKTATAWYRPVPSPADPLSR